MLSARLFAFTAFFLSAIATPVPSDPDHPPWDQVYIKGITYAGSGCPAGSVAGTLAIDGSFINVAFDQYIASVGPGIPFKESRKNCQLTFQLNYPPGWSVTVFDARYEGYVKLDPKVTAKQQSSYRWAGSDPSAYLYSPFTGPVDKDYTFTDTLVASTFVWSSCKGAPGALVVNTQVQVENSKNPKGSGLITTDAIEGKVIHIYGCSWKRC